MEKDRDGISQITGNPPKYLNISLAFLLISYIWVYTECIPCMATIHKHNKQISNIVILHNIIKMSHVTQCDCTRRQQRSCLQHLWAQTLAPPMSEGFYLQERRTPSVT